MTKKSPVPCKDDEYREDLRRVFKEEYGIILSNKRLEVAARGIERLLEAFLN